MRVVSPNLMYTKVTHYIMVLCYNNIMYILSLIFIRTVDGKVSLCSEDDQVYGQTGTIAETLFKKHGPTADYRTGINTPVQYLHACCLINSSHNIH